MYVLAIRTVILFVLVIVLMRIMGKRTISELQPGELVVTLLISDIAAVPMQETGVPLLAGMIPITVLMVIEILVSCASVKSAKFSKLMSGTPVVVINNGEVDQAALKRLRMTNEDLFEGLRKDGVFDISAVSYAVVETDGALSVLQKSDAPMQALIVSDGEIDEHSMRIVGWDSDMIESAAKGMGLQVADIFIMTGGRDGSSTIIRRSCGEERGR